MVSYVPLGLEGKGRSLVYNALILPFNVYRQRLFVARNIGTPPRLPAASEGRLIPLEMENITRTCGRHQNKHHYFGTYSNLSETVFVSLCGYYHSICLNGVYFPSSAIEWNGILDDRSNNS